MKAGLPRSLPSFALLIHNLTFIEVFTTSVLLQLFSPPLLVKNLKAKTYHLLLLHHQKVGTTWSRLTLTAFYRARGSELQETGRQLPGQPCQ